jgi:endonuclease YncB( thermonuclease family)
MGLNRFLSISLLFLFLPSICAAWSGTVIGISDGDTITVLRGKTPIKIRLHGIDCPERGQAFGKRAKRFASEMVYKKTVTIAPTDKDRYGRTVAWVYVDDMSLNEALVSAGLAWHYKKYSSDRNLSEAEIRARDKKVGLWSDPDAIPPWEYRRLKRK